MKPFLILSFIALLSSGLATAQNIRFPKEGVIEYEKRVNVHAEFRKNINKNTEMFLQPMFDQYKKSQPQFKVFKSTLTFSQNASLFIPTEEAPSNNFWSEFAALKQPNIVYTDFQNNNSITQKKVYEQNYLLKDSVRNIKWKITSETREIAGYSCRRANALIMDSIYVVAFYTDKIPVSGGPESFTGLPGMILGVALPHENITWFATSVTDKAVVATSIKPPSKGKAANREELKSTIMSAFKNWGDYARAALKAYLL